MSQYYFAVASLPMLRFDDPPALSQSEFIEVCENNLKLKDYKLILNARLDNFLAVKPTCLVLDKWRLREINLRNELVKLRASRKGLDPEQYLVDCEILTGISEYAQEAFGLSSPLEAENLLIRTRWLYLEELEVGHYFDEEKLVVYSLKIQLLERKTSLQREKGQEVFNQINLNMKEQIQTRESFYG